MPLTTRGFITSLILFLLAFAVVPGSRAENAPATQPDAKKTAYLFAYFIGNGEDGLHLAASSDGLKWEALRGGKRS
jgi:hypothetical protein